MRSTIVILVVLLTGCSVATQQIDRITGTDIKQRCVDYQGVLTTAVALQEIRPTAARAERIVGYRLFMAANCSK